MENMGYTYSEHEILKGHRGPCGPVAISRAFNISLEEALGHCEAHGFYTSDRGMFISEFECVLDELVPRQWVKIRYNRIENGHFDKSTREFVNHRCKWSREWQQIPFGNWCENCGNMPQPRRQNDRPTLTKFCASNPTGIFIIHVSKHYLVVKNGCVIDPAYHRLGKSVDKRRVCNSWKVG